MKVDEDLRRAEGRGSSLRRCPCGLNREDWHSALSHQLCHQAMELPRPVFLSLRAALGHVKGKIKQRGWILSDMVRERRAQWPNGRDWGEGGAEGRTRSQPGDQPNTSQGNSRVSQRALGCAVKKVRPSRPDGASVAPEPPSGLRVRVREGMVLPPGPPRSHLQEEAGLPELPEVAVAVALARVMVRGPVFAAHVEDEWVANAGRKAIRAVREGVPWGLAHLPEPAFLEHIGGCASTHLPDNPCLCQPRAEE